MDSVANSDSDLSDDWSIVNAKEAPPISESESIEVIEADDDNEECCEADVSTDTDKETEDNDDNKSHERLTELEIASLISRTELPVSRIEELEVVPEPCDNNSSTRYCVFPEEFYNVFTLTENTVTTSELLCSISLVILCTVVSSFMVISADNLRPSFIDVLVWQSLPDNQKDIPSLGGINNQLKNRNEFLENRFNHLSLAVKAYEENGISDTALAEFVIDLHKSMGVNNDETFLNEVLFSILPKDRFIDNPGDKIEDSNIHQSAESDKEKEDISKENVPADGTSKATVDEKPVKVLNKLLSLFNTTSETGMLLNKASLVLLNTKDKLLIFQKSFHPAMSNNKSNLKFNKLSNRLDNIEAKINREINHFFNNFSKRIYGNIVNFDRNVHDYICNNNKINENDKKLIELCLGKQKRKEKENEKLKNKNNFKKDKFYSKQEQHEKNDKLKLKEKTNYNNLYKTDGDAIGKSKDTKFDSNKDKFTPGYKKYDEKTADKPNSKEPAADDKFLTVHDDPFSESKDSENEDKSKSTTHSLRQDERKGGYRNNGKYKNKETSGDYFKNNKREKVNLESRSVQDEQVVKEAGEVKKNDKNLPTHLSDSEEPMLDIGNKEALDEIENSDKIQNDEIINVNMNHKNIENKYDKVTFKKNKKNYEPENVREKNYRKSKHSGQYDEKRFKKNFDADTKSKGHYVRSNNKDSFLDERKENVNDYQKKQKYNSKYDKHSGKKGFADIRQIKEDILNSIHKYIDDLLTDFSRDQNENNNTSFSPSKFLSGDWFLTLGKKRSEIRNKEKRTDWLFNRAEGRNNIRDLNADLPFDSSLYEKTYWFFRRAWERNRIRF